MQPHQWKTLKQWHGSEQRDENGNVLPLVAHEPGETAFIPATEAEREQISRLLDAPLDQVAAVEPDRDRLERQGDIVDVGEVTLPVKPIGSEQSQAFTADSTQSVKPPEIPFQPAHSLPQPADSLPVTPDPVADDSSAIPDDDGALNALAEARNELKPPAGGEEVG